VSENAIVPYEQQNHQMTLAETMTLGDTLAKSGFFSDTKSAAQAVVKILAGQEMGFGPIASMTGINVIQGKVAVGANLMAASVKRDPRYDYSVIELTDDRCELAFYRGDKEIGRSVFTMQNARETLYWNAKTSKMEPLADKFNWKSYPRNMLFARAMSNGVKWYCPDASGGATIYTPDELGAVTDEAGEIIDVTPTVTPATELPQDIKSNGEHWIDKFDPQGHPIRPRFWAWAKTEMGLEESEVYAALNVEHIHEYKGTMKEARADITKWIAAQADAEQLGLEEAA